MSKLIRGLCNNGTETAIGMPLFVNIFNKSTEISLLKYRGIREGLFLLKITAFKPLKWLLKLLSKTNF
jgi:hypothetical protein